MPCSFPGPPSGPRPVESHAVFPRGCWVLLPSAHSATRRAFLSLFKHQIPFLTPVLPLLHSPPSVLIFTASLSRTPTSGAFFQNPAASRLGNTGPVLGGGGHWKPPGSPTNDGEVTIKGVLGVQRDASLMEGDPLPLMMNTTPDWSII